MRSTPLLSIDGFFLVLTCCHYYSTSYLIYLTHLTQGGKAEQISGFGG